MSNITMTNLPTELTSLNSRQRQAVINLVSGMSKMEAYEKAGFTPSNTISLSACASEFFLKPDIQAAYQALVERRDKLSLAKIQENIATSLERQSILSEIARHKVEQPVSAGHKIAAVAEMNKVEGSYAPSKVLIGKKIQFEIVYVDRKET